MIITLSLNVNTHIGKHMKTYSAEYKEETLYKEEKFLGEYYKTQFVGLIIPKHCHGCHLFAL